MSDHRSRNLCVCPLCRYLIEHGAQVGAVNSEGELPLDVATEDAMERLLKQEIKKRGEDKPLPPRGIANITASSMILSSIYML